MEHPVRWGRQPTSAFLNRKKEAADNINRRLFERKKRETNDDPENESLETQTTQIDLK